MNHKDKILTILQEYTDEPLQESDSDVKIIDMNLDSLDVMDFLYRLEGEFAFTTKINDDVVKNMTVNNLVEIIKM
jgi:acyl carrier protein